MIVFHINNNTLISSNQEINCINIEVWLAIRDFIEEIQNQKPN